MKLAAARAIAGLVEEPTADEIVPSPFDGSVPEAVAGAVGSLS
jgi:malate dehydrogenase (oxaloacetate-decarboxylating)